MKNYKKTLRACYLGFITQAIAANFAPLLFLAFHSDFNISLGQIALIPAVFYVTQLSVDLICAKYVDCNGVQREHNKKLNNGLPILHKVPPKRDYGRYFCIMAEKGGTSHGGLD